MDFNRSIFENRKALGRPLLTAHRGVCGANVPCNTLAAFKIALDQGADVVEIDVAKTKDGKFYVFHPGMEHVFLRSSRAIADMTAEEAVDFFDNLPKIRRRAQTLVEVGLGYVKLGQSSTTLSGGEAQRVKLATELARVSTGKTIYILDEPTTGLHAADVHKLIDVLQQLVDAGNTVLVIEHNLDVIKTADHIIDLGPEGGDAGGRVVAAGTPEAVAQVAESYTGQYLKRYL